MSTMLFIARKSERTNKDITSGILNSCMKSIYEIKDDNFMTYKETSEYLNDRPFADTLFAFFKRSMSRSGLSDYGVHSFCEIFVDNFNNKEATILDFYTELFVGLYNESSKYSDRALTFTF